MRFTRCDCIAIFLAACAAVACRDDRGNGAPRDSAPPAGPAPAISVAGTIRAAAGSAVDGDVNDPAAALAANDTLSSAQRIPNPVRLGGYANQPGAGSEGRSRADGDVRDLYLVSLVAGDRIELESAEAGPENDLDLALLSLAGVPLAVAAEAGGTELLMATASGDHIVEVSAFAGASGYVLSISPGSAAAQVQPEFVPSELIVRMRGASALGGAATGDVSALGMRWAAGAPGEAQLLRCGSRDERDTAFR
jgi:serine protease